MDKISITKKEAGLIARALGVYEDQNEGLLDHGEPQLIRSIRSKIKNGKSGITENPSDMLPDSMILQFKSRVK
jgi:hypothetical protein